MANTVYKKLKKIRELKGLTREYVSAELGMSSSGYSKIERGEVDINLSKLEKIAAVLGVSLEYIFRFNIDNILNM